MRTISKVHSQSQRQAMRMEGELRARRSMIRLAAAVSILRTALTQLLPIAGSAGWWVIPACLMPGLAVYALLAWVMRRTNTVVLSDALRALMGRAGGMVLSVVLAALVLIEGTASMTALITFFTEGIGTEGTQITLSLLTAGVLLCCLNREGLPRGVYLLRWVMLPALAVMAGNALLQARLDHAFPLLGEGSDTLWTVLRSGASLGWPLTLLLTAEPVKPGKRLREALPVLALCAAVTAAICLSLPHELLTSRHDLSGSLLEWTIHLAPAVRTLGQCLLMLVLFLSVGAASHLVTDAAAAPLGRAPGWLPYAVVILLALSQCLEVRMLWQALCVAQAWLLLPLAVIALTAAGWCLLRRRKA